MFSCRERTGDKKASTDITKVRQTLTKPASTFQDTLKVDFTAAVFYHSDSLQLQKMKEITDPGVFDASMHEYFYQMRNARISIKKDYPTVKIVEAKNLRFILFIGNASHVLIDLDTKNDPYGLFLFEQTREPHISDMMNIDTELGFYFKN